MTISLGSWLQARAGFLTNTVFNRKREKGRKRKFLGSCRNRWCHLRKRCQGSAGQWLGLRFQCYQKSKSHQRACFYLKLHCRLVSSSCQGTWQPIATRPPSYSAFPEFEKTKVKILMSSLKWMKQAKGQGSVVPWLRSTPINCVGPGSHGTSNPIAGRNEPRCTEEGRGSSSQKKVT